MHGTIARVDTGRPGTAAPLTTLLQAMSGAAERLTARLVAWRLARLTRHATAGLETRLRADIGLEPQRTTAPALPSMADAWMR